VVAINRNGWSQSIVTAGRDHSVRAAWGRQFGRVKFGGVVQGATVMNGQADHLDEDDEEILTATISDEALEAAAGTVRGELYSDTSTQLGSYCFPCGGSCGG
jgi:hypothetical protein